MLAVVLLLGFVGVVLAPILDVGFVYDDRADVLDNPAAQPGGFFAALGQTNRPLVKATYALQRAVTGTEPRFFHAVNLALHLAATFAVLALGRRLADRIGAPRADLIGAVAAAIWALHPAAVETVAPISGRSLLLSTPLMIMALLLITSDEAPGRRACIGAALLACLAPMARETALVLPALGLAWQATLGASESRATALRRQLPLICGSLLGAFAIALSERHRELVAFSLATRPPLEALRSNLFALFEIVRFAVDPGRISIDPATPTDLPWTDISTLLRLVLILATAAFAWIFRRRRPLTAFAILWLLLALTPANSFIWRLDPVSARPLYLASVLPFVAMAAAAGRATARLGAARPRLRSLLIGATVVLVLAPTVALATRSRERARLYTDPAGLWSDAAAKSPDSSRAWANLGVQMLIADRLDEADSALRHALALAPGDTGLQCALDSIYIRRRTLAVDERSWE